MRPQFTLNTHYNLRQFFAPLERSYVAVWTPTRKMPTRAHDVLGVPPNASLQEAKTAYHNLCRKYHPDKNLLLGTHESSRREVKFMEVQSAYEQFTADATEPAPGPTPTPVAPIKRKSVHLRFKVKVSLEQLLDGGHVNKQLYRHVRCVGCKCHRCDGAGRINGSSEVCLECMGKGKKAASTRCSLCKDAGVERISQLFSIILAKGMRGGEQFRFPGLNETPGHITGDVFIHLRVKDHPRVYLHDAGGLCVDVFVPSGHARWPLRLRFPTLYGESVVVNVPGSHVRGCTVKGMGMQSRNPAEGRDSLYVNFFSTLKPLTTPLVLGYLDRHADPMGCKYF